MTKDEAIKMGLDLCKERLGVDGSAVIPELVCAIYGDIEQNNSPKLRDVNDSDLVEGKIFKTNGGERVEYRGIDRYMGVSTYEFRQLENGGKPYYCRMEYLSKYLCQIEGK